MKIARKDDFCWSAARSATPHIVTILNYKGGVAKSTLAINLAGVAAAQGRSAIVLDTDERQRSCSQWAEAADDPGFAVQAIRLRDAASALSASAGYEIVFVDTRGADEVLHDEIIRQSSLVLIPLTDSPLDFRPSYDVLKRVRHLGVPGRLVFVRMEPRAVRRVATGRKSFYDLLADLREAKVFMGTVIRRRAPLVDAMRRGLTVAGDPAAAASAIEHSTLLEEIDSVLAAGGRDR